MFNWGSGLLLGNRERWWISRSLFSPTAASRAKTILYVHPCVVTRKPHDQLTLWVCGLPSQIRHLCVQCHSSSQLCWACGAIPPAPGGVCRDIPEHGLPEKRENSIRKGKGKGGHIHLEKVRVSAEWRQVFLPSPFHCPSDTPMHGTFMGLESVQATCLGRAGLSAGKHPKNRDITISLEMRDKWGAYVIHLVRLTLSPPSLAWWFKSLNPTSLPGSCGEQAWQSATVVLLVQAGFLPCPCKKNSHCFYLPMGSDLIETGGEQCFPLWCFPQSTASSFCSCFLVARPFNGDGAGGSAQGVKMLPPALPEVDLLP